MDSKGPGAFLQDLDDPDDGGAGSKPSAPWSTAAWPESTAQRSPAPSQYWIRWADRSIGSAGLPTPVPAATPSWAGSAGEIATAMIRPIHTP